jgi:hypothetical protein
MRPSSPPKPWLRDAHGHRIEITDPEHARISIVDLADGLSRLCRFGGHLRPGAWYSVAAHSVMVSRIVPGRLAVAGLVHDGAEAYLGADMPSPVKSLFLDYKALEHRWQARVFEAFGIVPTPADHALLKRADRIAYLAERRDLRTADVTETAYWDEPGMAGLADVAADWHCEPGSPALDRSDFVDRAVELGIWLDVDSAEP